jgi:hypothetical protein
MKKGVFTQPGSFATFSIPPGDVGYFFDCVAKLDRFCAAELGYRLIRLCAESILRRSRRFTAAHLLRRTGDWHQWWRPAEELDEAPQVLSGCGQQHLIFNPTQASQPQAVELEDALHMRKLHLDFFALPA